MSAKPSAVQERLTTIFARTSTRTLVDTALVLDALAAPTQEQRLSLAWTLDEIERREPWLSDVLEDWVNTDDRKGSYTQTVVAALAVRDGLTGRSAHAVSAAQAAAWKPGRAL